jgi:copper chaperone
METTMTQAFRVTGMTCDGCARAVTGAIKARAPSASVTVNLADGIVTVGGAVDAKIVAAAIEDAGFGFSGPV